MSIIGLKLKKELEGDSVLPIENIVSAKKSISTTRSFENTITEFEEIKERISTFAVCCAEKLRIQNTKCNLIYVFIRSNKFQKINLNIEMVFQLLYLFQPTYITVNKYVIQALKIFLKGFITKSQCNSYGNNARKIISR